ncbi:MAG: hypothetical protein ACR2K6_06060 [Solirubrobacterales bacterium]
MSATPSSAATEMVERLDEIAPGIKAIAVLHRDELVAASSEGAWLERCRRLWELADAEPTGAGAASQIHIGVEEGEVFGLREGELRVVAVTNRLVLASLVFWDLRAIIRGIRSRHGG